MKTTDKIHYFEYLYGHNGSQLNGLMFGIAAWVRTFIPPQSSFD